MQKFYIRIKPNALRFKTSTTSLKPNSQIILKDPLISFSDFKSLIRNIKQTELSRLWKELNSYSLQNDGKVALVFDSMVGKWLHNEKDSVLEILELEPKNSKFSILWNNWKMQLNQNRTYINWIELLSMNPHCIYSNTWSQILEHYIVQQRKKDAWKIYELLRERKLDTLKVSVTFLSLIAKHGSIAELNLI
jgi:hypothetical protein